MERRLFLMETARKGVRAPGISHAEKAQPD